MFNMHTNKYEKICHGLDLIVSDECLYAVLVIAK